MSELLYVYGFVPAEMDEFTIDVTGIGGARVGLLYTDDGPHAVVSRLDPGEYSAEAIDTRMTDLAWVAEQGVAHERVVSWFIDRGHILPAPLFTLYSSETAVRGVIAAQRERLERELERLRGLREWDLKVSFDRGILARNAARRLALDVFEDARAHACDAVVLPLPDPGAALPVVFNSTLLVAADQEPAILERIAHARRACEPAGLKIEFSGPWAPYRFIDGASMHQS